MLCFAAKECIRGRDPGNGSQKSQSLFPLDILTRRSLITLTLQRKKGPKGPKVVARKDRIFEASLARLSRPLTEADWYVEWYLVT
jgi:hypothetical protein